MSFGGEVGKMKLWKENPAALKLVFVVLGDVSEVFLQNLQTIGFPKKASSLIDIPGIGSAINLSSLDGSATIENLKKLNVTITKN
jgi:hypothetical protein